MNEKTTKRRKRPASTCQRDPSPRSEPRAECNGGESGRPDGAQSPARPPSVPRRDRSH